MDNDGEELDSENGFHFTDPAVSAERALILALGVIGALVVATHWREVWAVVEWVLRR